jgi:hypothetical protein
MLPWHSRVFSPSASVWQWRIPYYQFSTMWKGPKKQACKGDPRTGNKTRTWSPTSKVRLWAFRAYQTFHLYLRLPQILIGKICIDLFVCLMCHPATTSRSTSSKGFLTRPNKLIRTKTWETPEQPPTLQTAQDPFLPVFLKLKAVS